MIHKETNDRTENEIFHRWYKNKKNKYLFDTNILWKIIHKQKVIKSGQYTNALNSYKKELENATVEELTEACYKLKEGIDPSGSIGCVLSGFVGAFASAATEEILNMSNALSILIATCVAIIFGMIIYQSTRQPLETFRLNVMETRIKELSSTHCNSCGKLNYQDKCKRNNDSASHKKKQNKGGKKSKR